MFIFQCLECHQRRLGNDRTKVQRGERTYPLLRMLPTKQEKKKMTVPLTRATQAPNKDNTHN